MTEKQFKEIEDLNDDILNYARILKEAKSERNEGFCLRVLSDYSPDYHFYDIDDKEITDKIIELIEEKLDELKRKFSAIAII